ncbi:hypothetical protein F4814DRAFT_125562 [Daldinia grandis]|nr:hypothetical protein F4814DRAFT_125562 [Daldinia grandis]
MKCPPAPTAYHCPFCLYSNHLTTFLFLFPPTAAFLLSYYHHHHHHHHHHIHNLIPTFLLLLYRFPLPFRQTHVWYFPPISYHLCLPTRLLYPGSQYWFSRLSFLASVHVLRSPTIVARIVYLCLTIQLYLVLKSLPSTVLVVYLRRREICTWLLRTVFARTITKLFAI